MLGCPSVMSRPSGAATTSSPTSGNATNANPPLIVNNHATHTHAEVRACLAKHPRCHMHSTPTSSSWTNMVEPFFRDLTVDIVRHARFTSFKKPSYAITKYLAERNLNPTRYEWRADGAETLAKIMRAREKAGILVQWT